MPQSERGPKDGGNETGGDFNVVIKKKSPLEVFKQRDKRL